MASAYRLIKHLDRQASAHVLQPEEYVTPDRALRDGPAPELRRHPSLEASHRFVLEWIRTRLARGVPPASILVLGLGTRYVARLAAELNGAGVPASLLSSKPAADVVKVSTIHSAKGLDAAHVVLVGAHELDRRGEEGRRLLYIAMTRATEEVCLCAHRDCRLMAEVDAAVELSTAEPARSSVG